MIKHTDLPFNVDNYAGKKPKAKKTLQNSPRQSKMS